MSDPVADAKKALNDAAAAAAKALADARTNLTRAKVAAIAEKAGIRLAIAASPLTSVLIAFAIGLGLGVVAGAWLGTKL